MAEWTHRHCERCWFDRPDQKTGQPFGENEDGSYRQPVQTLKSEPGACCGCGGMTITGIFIRAKEDTLLCKGRHDDMALWSDVKAVAADSLPKRST